MRVGNQGTGWPGMATGRSLSTEGTGKAAEGAKKTAAGTTAKGLPRDVLEVAAGHASRDLFGQAPRLPSKLEIDSDGWKNVDYEGDSDPYTPGKQPFDMEEPVAWMEGRDQMEEALDTGMARTTQEARDQIRMRDGMDALIRTLSEAEVSKAFNLRTDPTRGVGTPEGTPVFIKVDRLDGEGAGGTGTRPNPGQGGTLTGGAVGGGEAGGGTLTGGVGFGGDGGGGGVHHPNQKGGGGGVYQPNQMSGGGSSNNPVYDGSSNNKGDGGVHGHAAGEGTSSESTSTADAGGGDSGGTTCEQPRSERDPVGYINDGVDTQMCRDQDQPAELSGGSPGEGGDDCRPRGLPPPARITNQERDLVGPAFGTTTGPDDKERPNTGASSGAVAGDPWENRTDDVGGHRRPGFGGGGEAGPLWKDLRVLNPNDPSKV